MLGLLLIIAIWIVYGLWKMLFDTPQSARKVTDAEVKALNQLPDVKARRKWLRNGGYKNLH